MMTGVVYGAIGLHTKGGRVTPGQLNVYLKVQILLSNRLLHFIATKVAAEPDSNHCSLG